MEYYAGIDLGGTNIKCGIVDETGTVIKYESIPTNREKGFSNVVSTMAELVKNLSKAVSVRVKAVGVGAPGTIDGENGVVVYSNNLAWENVPLAAELGNELHLPVRITNDANAAAYGEYLCGAGKEYRSIVMLTLGTGVGSGIVIDGKLFEGNRGAGAELGHEVIRFGGEKCTCGRRGCFEAYASATALIRQTKRAMEHNVGSIMWKLCSADINNVNGRTAFDGMRSGDNAAKKVVDSYINYLSVGVTNVVNAIRPEAVILGGGVCAEGDALTVPLTKKVEKSVFGGVRYAPVKILTASLGNMAGIIGAANLYNAPTHVQ